MPKSFSSYLKLHRGEENETTSEINATPKAYDLGNLLDAFTEATGWRACLADSTPHSPSHHHSLNRYGSFDGRGDSIRMTDTEFTKNNAADLGNAEKLTRLKLVDDMTIDGMLDITDTVMLASEEAASSLLTQIESLVHNLQRAEATIERQEAQLASTLGVSIRPEDSEELAGKFQEALHRAVLQTASDAAAIYLLDENTSELAMRSCWGLPKGSLMKPARPLRGSLADLEAMLGNAVLLENTQHAHQWNCPENFPAAMCVPIGSPSAPQGTLWLWSHHVRDFSTLDIESAKAAADKVLADIERSSLTEEVLRTRSVTRDVESASVLQASRQAVPELLHRDYDVAGWTFPGQTLGGQFHNWTFNQHGELIVAMGDAELTGAGGAIVATTLQSVVETCWNAKHEPKQVFRKANDMLWAIPDGDWRCSLGYMQLAADSGAGKYCVAGSIQAFVVGPRGYRILGNTSTLLGEQPDTRFQSQSIRLEGGELLVMVSQDVVSGLLNGGLTQTTLLNMLQQMYEEPVQDIVDHLARMLPMPEASERRMVAGSHEIPDRSLVILRRRF